MAALSGLAGEQSKMLLKMKRAHDRRTGCNLSASEIQLLGLTFIAELWADVAEATATDAMRKGGDNG